VRTIPCIQVGDDVRDCQDAVETFFSYHRCTALFGGSTPDQNSAVNSELNTIEERRIVGLSSRNVQQGRKRRLRMVLKCISFDLI
jgi:hypothetical protein